MMLLQCATILLQFCLSFQSGAAQVDDLYIILGVTSAATSQEIKKAYRRKALDTHPDKNKAVGAEEAAEAFRQVVLAFEVLSDPERRELYDATGRTTDLDDPSQAGYGGEQEQYHWHFHWHYENGYDHHQRWHYENAYGYHQQQHHATTHLRDTWEAQNAQSRLLHITSLEQFRTVMVDGEEEEQERVERHFVVCFVKPGPMEALALDEMVFPYPFAGMSDQGIWWESILQTMYVSVTQHQAPLAEFFGISLDDSNWDKPLFLYGKAGSTWEKGEKFPRIHTANRGKMERFVWDNLRVEIEFVNGYSHPVELFWMNEDGDAMMMEESLGTGESVSFTSSLSQVWFARDKRVDDFKHPQERYESFSDESVLMAFHVLEESQVFNIPQRTCFDLATDCPDWAQYGECMRRPAQMERLCAYSCDHCEEEEVIYHLYQGHEEL